MAVWPQAGHLTSLRIHDPTWQHCQRNDPDSSCPALSKVSAARCPWSAATVPLSSAMGMALGPWPKGHPDPGDTRETWTLFTPWDPGGSSSWGPSLPQGPVPPCPLPSKQLPHTYKAPRECLRCEPREPRRTPAAGDFEAGCTGRPRPEVLLSHSTHLDGQGQGPQACPGVPRAHPYRSPQLRVLG